MVYSGIVKYIAERKPKNKSKGMKLKLLEMIFRCAHICINLYIFLYISEIITFSNLKGLISKLSDLKKQISALSV